MKQLAYFIENKY